MIVGAAGSFAPKGPVARVMEDLWWFMLWLGVAVFAVFLVLLVLAVVRRRVDEPGDEDTGTARHGGWLVLGGVALPTVVIVVVFAATIAAMRVVPSEAPTDALEVTVVGHQWWWEVHYPDQGVTTANEIHIPAGRPVAFTLTSDDVIHSFWVPELGGKIDLLPERENTLVLEADAPGEFRGSCAEFCGLQHARMRLLVVAHTEADFDRWVEEQRRPAVAPADDATRRGQEVFLGSGCAACHAIRDVTPPGQVGPDLTHLASRQTLGAGTWPNTRDRLEDLITRPQEVKPGIEMSRTELDQRDLAALLDYLDSLR
jgi:cytochrome c oxidase subunit 2